MSCRDPDPTPAPRGAHSYHSCLATPPFRPCRTGGPFSDTKTGPRTRIPGRLFLSAAFSNAALITTCTVAESSCSFEPVKMFFASATTRVVTTTLAAAAIEKKTQPWLYCCT